MIATSPSDISDSNNSSCKTSEFALEQFKRIDADAEDIFRYQKNTEELAAVCCLHRTGSLRKEKYYFTIGMFFVSTPRSILDHM